jgi:hypothetical protein
VLPLTQQPPSLHVFKGQHELPEVPQELQMVPPSVPLQAAPD